ncbi:hypothetical protein [Fibrella arboris]|uniref:hypothetical protein n=1 Tax=Fibrella arboris TaxID=3242486 RepID=UPI003521B886
MPIPANIRREHIFQAMLRIKREGVPNGREPSQWVLNYEGDDYPCKLLISWLNIYANGQELNPNHNNFQTDMARRFLTNLGFTIVPM